MFCLYKAGDIVHVSQRESAVGGSGCVLVEFLHYGGTGKGKEERRERAALSQARCLSDFDRGPFGRRKGDVSRFAQDDAKPRGQRREATRGLSDEGFSLDTLEGIGKIY